MDLVWFLTLSALVFSIGVVGILIRRSPLVILLCLELMLNGANLTLAAFAAFLEDMAGNVLVVFTLAVAAAEVAVGLAILVALSRLVRTANVDEMDELRG